MDTTGTAPPVPGLAKAARAYLSAARAAAAEPCEGATPRGGGYGDDMAFLAAFLAPRLTEANTMHHVDGEDRATRRFGVNKSAIATHRRPFPTTPYRGFVGQPVKCTGCSLAEFAVAGCPHVCRDIPGAVASQLQCEPNALAVLSGFLG